MRMLQLLPPYAGVVRRHIPYLFISKYAKQASRDYTSRVTIAYLKR